MMHTNLLLRCLNRMQHHGLMMSGYIHGLCKEDLEVVGGLMDDGLKCDVVTFINALKACTGPEALAHGRLVHTTITRRGYERDIFVGSSLIGMYARCANIRCAQHVFVKMPRHDLVTWNAMITAYAKCGQVQEAFNLFRQMDQEGVKPNKVTFLVVLKVCAGSGDLKQGKSIHEHIIKSFLVMDTFVGSTLIAMYTKCGRVDDACCVFNKICNRNVVSWNALIAGYVQHGHTQAALELFKKMQLECIKPDNVTFVSILKVCASLAALRLGRQTHVDILKGGIMPNISVGNTLVDMYAKCGNIADAFQVFDTMVERDMVSWTVMLSGYAYNRKDVEAFELFQQMEAEGMKSNGVTYVVLLKACASLEQVKMVHSHIRHRGYESDVFVGSALVDMYAKCGSIENAYLVFNKIFKQGIVPWNVMIAGYAQIGFIKEAFELFQKMQQEAIEPDEITFLSILKVCTSLGLLKKGKRFHAYIMITGIEPSVSIENALINMYAKCGDIEDACTVFEKMSVRDVVSCNAMISRYAHHENAEESVKVFWQMEREGIKPDEITFLALLKACASLGILEFGKHIHALLVKAGFETLSFVGSSNIDMYAKCGSLMDAWTMFNQLPQRTLVSWTVMLSGCAQHGCVRKAFHLAGEMLREGVILDHITFVGLLSACSHSGLVNEACAVFGSMSHHVIPTMEHYTCIIDLLGRAGRLQEAMKLTEKMPFKPSAAVWMACLGGCRFYSDVDRAKYVVDNIIELEPHNSAALVLLSNIYAAAGRWEATPKVSEAMQKDSGCNYMG